MIARHVTMTFVEERVPAFRELFLVNKDRIASFPGCHHVWLLADPEKSNVFHTWSIWEDEEALNRYRESELFEEVWGTAKKLFEAKPTAISYPIESIT